MSNLFKSIAFVAILGMALVGCQKEEANIADHPANGTHKTLMRRQLLANIPLLILTSL